jgi:DNA polymerase-3 subunit delta'
MNALELGIDGLMGFSAVIDRMRRSIRADRVAHAQILLGPRGSGKRTLAKAYARALLCTGTGEKPCGLCGSCLRVLHGNHPDFIVFKPAEGALKVEDVKALLSEAIVRPYEGGRKVLAVYDAHTMNVPAQNKLLKMLEEPPAYAVILLLCETAAPLLETVRSRCQIVRMPRVNRDVIAGLLTRRFGLDDEAARTLAALSDGRVGRAYELAGSEEALSDRDEAISLLGLAMNGKDVLRALEGLTRRRNDAIGVLWIWQDVLRDALVMKSGGGPIVHADRRARIGGMVANFTQEELLARMEAVTAAERALRGNGAFLPVCHRLLLTIGGYATE